jgi:hypothetical protein
MNMQVSRVSSKNSDAPLQQLPQIIAECWGNTGDTGKTGG